MELTLEKIKLKTTEEKPCQVTLAVQIPSEIITDKTKKVAEDFQKVAQLPGFRAGKAPLELIHQNYSKKIMDETLEQILKDAVPKILREKSLSPVTYPMIEKVEYDGKNSL